MSKFYGTSLALAGISVGIYTVLSGADIGGSRPKVSADTSVHTPTPLKQTPVEDAAAGVIPPAVLEIADGAVRVAYLPSSAPLDGVRLTRTIQAQLKRVGCYHGAIDGVWSASVRRSMKTFTERVNATLPVEQPDIILLAMLQSHQDGGCGVPCPPGHGLAADGPCLPNRLIARIAEKQAPAGPADTATASSSVADRRAVGQPPSNEERMSLAGPALPPATSDAPAQAGRRRASAPASAPPSGRFPRWAARAFESW